MTVFRPQAGTETLPHDPSNLLMNNPSGLAVDIANVPILFTTVKNETGYNIQAIFANPTPASALVYDIAVKTLVNVERGRVLLESGFYPLSNTTDGLRDSLEKLATDAAFRCPNRELARRYAGAGGKVFVGEFEQGVSYSSTTEGYCGLEGVVCHSVSDRLTST